MIHPTSRGPVDTALIPGFGMNRGTYTRPIKALHERGHRVIALYADRTEELWNPQAAVVSMVRHLEGRRGLPTNVVGHSFGGAAAILLARERPDLVAELTLVDAAGIPFPGRTPTEWLAALARCVPAVDLRSLGALILRHVFESPRLKPTNLASAGAWVLHADLRSDLAALATSTVTVSVIWGSDDHLFPQSMGEEMASLTGGTLALVSGDHDWPLRSPQEFADSVEAAIQSRKRNPEQRSLAPSA